MARKKAHEEHVNHEAWAIPYGDLLVLLLAFFVVMYAVSSVNEGKYRVLSDSLHEAFGGAPRSLRPVQFGQQQKGSLPDSRSAPVPLRAPRNPNGGGGPAQPIQTGMPDRRSAGESIKLRAERRLLETMGQQIEAALGELVRRGQVRVRATALTLEVEIGTDILYPSGSAQLVPEALPILEKVAGVLAGFGNPLRIEGHTDTLPIATSVFPSNWELSAARAASVVHLFAAHGIEQPRMSLAGFGEFRPAADNGTSAGRDRNRRVTIVVLAREDQKPAIAQQDSREAPQEQAQAHAPPQAAAAPMLGAAAVEGHP